MSVADGLVVLHVIDTLGPGGAQRLVLELARRSVGLGVTTVVATFDEGDGRLAAELRAAGCPTHEIRPRRRQSLLDRTVVPRLTEVVRSSGADVVHLHLEYATILGALAARRAGRPCIVTIHNETLEFGRFPRLKSAAFDRAVRSADHVVACGHTVAAAHEHRVAAGAMVALPNPVPERAPAGDGGEDWRRRLGVRDADPVVVSVGRVTEAKGALDLVDAFAHVVERHPNAHLLLVGSGDAEERVADLARSRGLTHCVHLLGQRDDVAELLAAADVFASAAHVEGLPLAVLEAMAAGVPVVATAVGEVPRVLEGRGVLAPARRPDEFGRQLGDLLADPARRRSLAGAAQCHVRREHDPGSWVGSHMELYARAAGRGAIGTPGGER